MPNKERRIVYRGHSRWAGAHYVQFQIEGQDYVYAMSDERAARMIDQMVLQHRLFWQGLDRAKKRCTMWFKAGVGWPEGGV